MVHTEKTFTKRRILNSGSIFPRIFLSLLTLFVILIFVITFWVNQIASVNHRRESVTTHLGRLSAADRTLYQVMESLSGNLTQVQLSKDVVGYSLRPFVEDQSQYLMIINQMKNVVKSSGLISRAAFYSPLSDKVFQSSSERVINLEEYNDMFIFGVPHTAENGFYQLFKNEGQNTESFIYYRDGRIWIVQDFVLGEVLLSNISYELDVPTLAKLVSEQSANSWNTVYVFDEDGTKVFLAAQSYKPVPENAVFLPDDQIITNEDRADAVKKDAKLYMLRSETLPFIYISPVNRAELTVSIRDTIMTWLPAILLMFAISIFVTYYAVRSIYRPINRLLELTVGREPHQPQSGNEVVRLESVYSDAVREQQQMSQVMENVADEIVENLLKKLLTGYPYSEKELQETLHSIADPVPVQGRFLVCCCEIMPDGERDISESERMLYLPSLSNLVRDFQVENAKVFPIPCDNERLSVLLSFENEPSAVVIKRVFMQLQSYLLQNTSLLPYNVSVECGQIINNLLEAGASYREAMETIEYKRKGIVSTEEKQTMESEEDTDPAADEGVVKLDVFWARQRMDEIIALVTAGEVTAARLKMGETLERLKSFRTELNELKFGFRQLWEVLTERVVTYPLTPEEEELVDENRFREMLTSMEDRETLIVFMEEKCNQIIALIRQYHKKAKYRYVDEAKSYIAEHYTDSDLSLSDVAEKIGISSSYLSEQFNEVGGGKFSSYLSEYRVGKAMQLLSETYLSAKDIGERCGFNSPQNFTRVFKKVTGMTPAGYRESKKS